jgi:hypothetical protein
MPKYIFVTGGVVSSLGKGLAASSIGCLLESRGLRVALIKLDPYINVDPGTMSPFQHGEVFVTDDGAETDLDLGHYERFSPALVVAPRIDSHANLRDVRDCFQEGARVYELLQAPGNAHLMELDDYNHLSPNVVQRLIDRLKPVAGL